MEETISDKLWNSIRTIGKNVETSMDPLTRKRTGSYFTDLSLTDVMMQELVDSLDLSEKRIEDFTFFEPCVGSGNFVFSYLKAVKSKVDSKVAVKKLLNNLYVADVNKEALVAYRQSLSLFAYECWGIELPDAYFNSHIGSGLLIDITAQTLSYIPLKDVFNDNIALNGFDIVATNPPYKNLKAEMGHYHKNEEYEVDKKKYLSISQIVASRFKYSVDGVLNLYKLFVEEIIDKYTNENAHISLLIPSSILSDKTCEKLRTHILCDTYLQSVKIISEGSGLIDAQQALCALLISKGEQGNQILITKDYCRFPHDVATVQLSDILNKNTGNAIISVSEDEYSLLKKLSDFPVVKDLDFIINLRGELDLTNGKKFITDTKTKYTLLKGRNIGFYCLYDLDKCDFVLDKFAETTKKEKYIYTERIVCQQIANMNKPRRITFAYVPAGYVLGNSCNFICITPNKFGIDLYALLGLFNSKIINWLFKLTSSNNHVNNYEIDNFPVPIHSRFLKIISMKVKEYLSTNDECILEEIEELSLYAYGLSEEGNNKIVNYNEFVIDYLSDIRYIIPDMSLEDARKILDGKINVDSLYSGLNQFERKVANGITDKYVALNKREASDIIVGSQSAR